MLLRVDVNRLTDIAGFDFGCLINVRPFAKASLMDTLKVIQGTDTLADVAGPIPGSQYNGPQQMRHFTRRGGLNIYRLPTGWQFLLENEWGEGVLGGPLNRTNIDAYNELVQGCLATGAHCIIDIHNYARWDGGVSLSFQFSIHFESKVNTSSHLDHRTRRTKQSAVRPPLVSACYHL